ncbi:ABC transporter substrate-binding protein [Streptomyces sp. E11-3]|uniref:ABC transporter substrate-binding protein n=1 Tax=Streptomyces sp. E11-3 TaxID=3110112 RepID=UPI0039803B86
MTAQGSSHPGLSRRNFTMALGAALVAVPLAACGGEKKKPSGGGGSGDGNGAITFGFAQVGSESGWRTANTTSIKESAKKAGITLKFSDAQQKQENQIAAIRSFITQKVDVIGFSPVVESGWDTVLKEARDAKIPVILTDRAVDSADDSLYVTFIGSDFVEEGRRAGKWLVEDTKEDGPFNIVVLEGTTGSAPANDRKKGFAEIVGKDKRFRFIASQTGDFTRAKGKEVMESFLKSHKDIDVLFAHNDDMAIGAIQAIEEAGKKPGEDIRIVSIDGIKEAFQAMADGKINTVVECNPLIGPQVMDLVKKVAAGESVDKRIEAEEGVFTQDQAEAELPNRKY